MIKIKSANRKKAQKRKIEEFQNYEGLFLKAHFILINFILILTMYAYY